MTILSLTVRQFNNGFHPKQLLKLIPHLKDAFLWKILNLLNDSLKNVVLDSICYHLQGWNPTVLRRYLITYQCLPAGAVDPECQLIPWFSGIGVAKKDNSHKNGWNNTLVTHRRDRAR